MTQVESILVPGAKFALVGEAPGADEVHEGKPFVGAAGVLLNSILKSVGIDRRDCSVLNVFRTRPPQNNAMWFFHGKREAKGLSTSYPPFNGKYLKPEWWSEVERVRRELADNQPGIIFALGGIALWALTGNSRITDHRGTLLRTHLDTSRSGDHHQHSDNDNVVRSRRLERMDSGLDDRGRSGQSVERNPGRTVERDGDGISEHAGLLPDCSILPTFHPVAVLRDYSLLPIATADFERGKRALAGSLDTSSKRIKVPETRRDLETAFEDLARYDTLAVDVETEDRQITCISIAPTPDLSYSIPIWSKLEPGWSAWSTDTEVFLYHKLKELLESRHLIFHNGTYDLTFLHAYGIVPRFTPHDTMMIQHSVQPEMRKSLGFMASLYTDNPSWKWRNPRRKKDQDKADE